MVFTLRAPHESTVMHLIYLNRLLQEAEEKEAPSLGPATVESERELVRVVAQMLMTPIKTKRQLKGEVL